MKHIIVICVGLATLVVVLSYARIRHHTHPGPERQAVTGALSPRQVRPSPSVLVASNAPVAIVPAMPGTNTAESNAVSAAAPAMTGTNWASEMAARYAELIKEIRAGREN